MSTTTCEICGKPDCPTVEVNGQKIVGCDRCCPDPSSQPILLGKGFKVSTTTELIKDGSINYAHRNRILIPMAELLERAEQLFKSGVQKALYHPFKDKTEVDTWLADFEKFQKGEG